MSTKADEADEGKQDGTSADEGVGLPMNLIKSLRQKGGTDSSEGGSSTSNAEGGNNSDNSALVSLGNTSFGFNFDSEEGNSDGGNGNSDSTTKKNTSVKEEKVEDEGNNTEKREQSVDTVSENQVVSDSDRKSSPSPTQDMSSSTPSNDAPVPTPPVAVAAEAAATEAAVAAPPPPATVPTTTTTVPAPAPPPQPPVPTTASSHNIAADAAVANLHSIASAYTKIDTQDDEKKAAGGDGHAKVKADSESNGGYNSDDEAARGFQGGGQKLGETSPTPAAPVLSAQAPVDSQAVNSTPAPAPAPAPEQGVENNLEEDDEERPKKKKRINDKKREERNAREKERSFRISKQINELRNLLSTGGVIVPKGTKSSVLTEAANYIRMLQQHQYRSEIDRHQLVQQIQVIGGGAHGQQAAQAIRHVAAKNGVWSLGNFGGVPPKSAMGYYQPGKGEAGEMQPPVDPIQQTKIEEHEYRSVFNNCAVGMAIASMGGAFIDCNQLFCQLSNYTKQEVCALTIFNLTARQDLQHAFDLISQLISPPMDAPASGAQQPIVLRGAMNNRNDLGLGVALVKGDDGIAKFFCVTLIKNPASPFDDSKPVPATIELIQGTPSLTRQMPKDGAGLDSAPAFTTG